MLTDEQRHQLTTTGVLRIPAVLPRTTADEMADAVWASLVARGVQRDDPASWPSGFVAKLQSLSGARAFDKFRTPPVAALADDLLGPERWTDDSRWGPALVTFPEPGPWTVPHKVWHLDLPGRGDPERPAAVRLFGYVTDVVSHGGGTLVVEGSHELVRRMVIAAPDGEAGSSAEVRKALIARHPWFRALCKEGGERVAQFMVDGDEIDGVRVRVAELTAAAGDVVTMLQWTMHNLSMNCADAPRFMVTHSIYRHR